MLVLSRKVQESIILSVNGEEIRVTLLDIRGKNIRLGIKAPKSVRILRNEIYEKEHENPIQQETDSL